MSNGLGLAARAGQLRIGTESVARTIGTGDAVVVVLASDAPPRVLRRFAMLLDRRSIPHKVVLDGERLGHAVGRERVVALAITDESLGRRVLELAEAVEG